MNRRQTDLPQQWLIVDRGLGDALPAMQRLPPGSGIILLSGSLAIRERRRLRRLARRRGLALADEALGQVARVHDLRELRAALLAGTELILLSPVFPTRSHPDWQPLAPMRAAALARLGRGRLLALGGMNARRFRHVQALGFSGWAGIDAFRT